MPGVTPLLVLRSGLLGVVAGLRTSIPAAALAVGGLEPESRPLALLARHGSRRLVVLAAAGELLVDKLPVTPDRVETVASSPVSSAARSPGRCSPRRPASGVAASRFRRWPAPAARTSAPGAASPHGAPSGREPALPDPVVAVAEDLVAVGLAAVAVRGA